VSETDGRFGPLYPRLAALALEGGASARRALLQRQEFISAIRRTRAGAPVRDAGAAGARGNRLSGRHRARRIPQQRRGADRVRPARRAADHLQQRERALLRAQTRQPLSRRRARSADRDDGCPGLEPSDIHAGLSTFDLSLYVAQGLGTDNFIASFSGPKRLAALFGMREPVPIIDLPHHDNHAFFSYMVSPFANDDGPVMVLVVDGAGDFASISHYVGARGVLRKLPNNDSLFDSLGTFFSVISATQGGWTMMSSQGMGAAAYAI
jgi:hypothetical protein